MPPNPDYPPWMGPQPPAGVPPTPPPPPAHGWPGPGSPRERSEGWGGGPGSPRERSEGWGGGPPPPPPPPAGSGLVTAIGVLNLIFSLVCGCASLGWATGWALLHDDPDQMTTAVVTWMRQVVEPSLERRAGGDAPAIRAIGEELSRPETVKDLLVAAGSSPATPTIRTATAAAGLAQAALFIGSILLLMRRNTGRVLSMLALLVFMGATIATWVEFSDPADQMAAELKTKVTATAEYRELPPPDREKADRLLSLAPEIFQGTVGSMSAFAMAWPAIAFLILLASRGIKDSCTPTYVRP